MLDSFDLISIIMSVIQSNIACEACSIKFSFLTHRKQCTVCLRYFCFECLFKRSNEILSCGQCLILQRLLAASAQINKRTHKYKAVKLSEINTISELQCLSRKQLESLLHTSHEDYKDCATKRELLDRAYILWKKHKQLSTGVDSDENLCKICYDRSIECIFLECAHMICCLKCGKRMLKCPICKQHVVRIVRFYKG